MTTLNIGILTASLSTRAGGLFQSVRHQANELTSQGCRVSVYGLSDDQYYAASSAWEVSRIKAFPVDGPARLGFSVQMLCEASAADHQLLHLQGLWSFPSCVFANWRRKTGRPTIISPRGMLDPWALRNSAWKKKIAMALFERRNLQGVSCLHALNDSEAQSIRSLGLSRAIAVIPNGVTLPLDGEMPPRPAFLGDDSRKSLLFLGRLHPKKGVVETLEGWAGAIQEKPNLARDWVLVMAGWDDGGHLDSLKAHAASLGLAGRVVFPGPLFGADKGAALAHASAFILASYSEGLPMAVLEAWAHRLPVFMTRACNLPEGFASGAAIEITAEPKVIAGVLGEYLDDAALQETGLHGRELVEAQFGWPRITEDLLAVYRWVVGEGTAPACVKLI